MLNEIPGQTSKRKKDHLELCLNEDVNFNSKTAGFENYEFIHNAVTEVDFEKINLTTEVFGKKIRYPFLISSMTGGSKEAERINSELALIAEDLKIALAVGSQRQALEDSNYLNSYKIIRKYAPGIPLFANIGAYQVAKNKNPVELADRLIDMIDSDALIIHLNPLQELMQGEGETDFSGLLKNISKITGKIKTPVIAKEVGAGIGKSAAKKLLEAGVAGIDVAGAGGTSWSAVEMLRKNQMNDYFRNWGIPTTECIREVSQLKKKYNFLLISSGGVDDGIKISKSIALGADLSASAKTVLHLLMNSGAEILKENILAWFENLKRIMYLTGCKSLDELKKSNSLRRID